MTFNGSITTENIFIYYVAPTFKEYESFKYCSFQWRKWSFCFFDKVYGFSSGHVWMWELDSEESWAPKNLCFWTVVLEKTLESPLDCKEIQPVHPKGDQSWVFIYWKGWCWSWNSNTLATWHEELPHWKRPWCWGRLKAGEGDNRGWDGGWHHWLNVHELSKLWEMVKAREAWHAALHGVTKRWTRLSDWTTTESTRKCILYNHGWYFT